MSLRGMISALFFIGAFAQLSMAQQVPIYTQYMFHQMAFNPAYAGTNGGICVNGLYRDQWLGFKDNDGNKVAPRTMLLTVDAPLRVLHGALGGSITSDRLGFFNNIGLKIGYAFRTDLGPGEFSAGIQADLVNYQLDFSKFDDHLIDPNDPVFVEKGEQSDLTIDADLGLFYTVPDKYYIGLSGVQLLQTTGKNTHYQQRRTFFLTGGYNFVFPKNPLFELKPSALVMYDGGAFQFNVTALLAYKKKFYGGLGYWYQDAISILAGANIKSFRIGLSYGISTSALTRYNSGTVEISLGYCFKIDIERARKRYKNTRFL